jgi:hypothetical protein
MSRARLALFSLVATGLMAATSFSLAAAAPSAAAIPPLVAAAQAPAARAYTGPGSCAAAACHGSIRAVAGSRILQTEYTTWMAQDRHARAAEVLSTPASVRMAKILGLPAANTASTCLACHTLDAPQAQQGRTFNNEGVSCESCHGPASAWLGPHTTRDWTHARSVQAGMYDTKDLVKRTEVCLACHLGTADKFVDHEMIAAGHPDLVFDLEAFSAAMPRHWRPSTEADPFAPVRSFMVGQLVHLRGSLERLARGMSGPGWPEYAELDCVACHHSLTRADDSWRQNLGYSGRRPGTPALNVARWVTARHVLAAQDAKAATDLNEVMTALERDVSRPRPNAGEVAASIARARTILDAAIARAVTSRPDAATAARLLRAITADVEEIAPRGERAAEQAAMALETLALATITPGAQAGEGAAVRAGFDELFQQFQNPSVYDPRRFIAQVRKIEAALGR